MSTAATWSTIGAVWLGLGIIVGPIVGRMLKRARERDERATGFGRRDATWKD